MKNWLLLTSVFLFAQVKVHACYYDFTNACGGYNSEFMLVKCTFPDAPPSQDPFVFCANPGWTQEQLEYHICRGSFSSNIENYLQCPNGKPSKAYTSIQPNLTKNSCGSTIVTDTQTLIEKINLTGISYPIVYSSQKIKGRQEWYSKKIPITSSSYGNPTNVLHELLTVSVAGQTTSLQLSPVTSLNYDFNWDGKDNNGNIVKGSWEAHISVAEYYNQPFTISEADIVNCDVDNGCVYPLRGNNSSALTSLTMSAPTSSKIILGTIFDEDFGFGGWDFEIHHHYDEVRKVLYYGDGSTLNSSYKEQINGDIWVVSRDRSEVYVFDTQKRHISTISSVTGKTKFSFSYGTNGRLSTITDAYNNITSLQYSGQNLISITSPYGQVTSVVTDSNGYLTSITNPASETYEVSYSATGLLLSFEKPSGTLSTMTYDSKGLLLTDSSSAGNSTSLT